MKQIAIVSGKGGTGKTTIASSFGILKENSLLADCDVDASNLYLMFQPKSEEEFKYYGGKKAIIDQSKCDQCGICEKVCRFEAIRAESNTYSIDQYACEGCNACVISCPQEAIRLEDSLAGRYFYSTTTLERKPLVYARLEPGEETSGGLVAEVRKHSLRKAGDLGKELIIIDGAPGIGCPTTSSIAGVDYVVIVTEPTSSGLHDLKRIIETVKHFRREAGVIVNKFDLNPKVSNEIKNYCISEGVDILGEIPFDEIVVKAVLETKPVVYYSDSKAGAAIKNIFEKVIDKLQPF